MSCAVWVVFHYNHIISKVNTIKANTIKVYNCYVAVTVTQIKMVTAVIVTKWITYNLHRKRVMKIYNYNIVTNF